MNHTTSNRTQHGQMCASLWKQILALDERSASRPGRFTPISWCAPGRRTKTEKPGLPSHNTDMTPTEESRHEIFAALGCHAARKYQYTLRNIQEDRRPHSPRGGNLKSRVSRHLRTHGKGYTASASYAFIA